MFPTYSYFEALILILFGDGGIRRYLGLDEVLTAGF